MGAIKTVILPGLAPGFQGAIHQIIARPPKMLNTAKNRICPSLSNSNWANILRQPAGETNGNSPSMTRTRAMANQIESLLKMDYFLVLAAGATPPRNTLKNSDEDGSSTMTSLLFVKLAL